jgi:glycosyltransferase involved in cell wall biosynthesis
MPPENRSLDPGYAMRIGIDASLVVGERAGVGFYTASLIDALAALDRRNEYVLYPFFYYIFDPRFKELKSPAPNFSVRFNSVPERWVRYLWFRSLIPRHLLIGNVDVLHSTTYCCPRRHPGKLVMTIHDISFLHYPEYHTEANRIHCLKGTMEGAISADRIIAVSEHTKKDLVEYLNVPDDRIVVTPLAARKEFHPRPQDQVREYVRRCWGLESPYLLSVGTLEPRKNIRSLIRAFCSLPNDVTHDCPLVIAGGKGWLSSDVHQLVADMRAESKVRFLGYIPEPDLPWLYCGATCFVYPSLYEGFGLPPLEAMASGIPVITSNTSSLPEVVGDTGLLVDPRSEEELKQTMIRALSDEGLRSEMSRKALDRSKLFSWERTAAETLRAYESCL